ncbi:YcdB/YcdC domain-containing protein [Bacillus sp. CGMCC 1.16607]|uniref:YcdB/YcdC domain-containing protein n=1 Tax=Bacillus sp. CGMCC 1.16607 TaxID=3351842 RepID=UPI00362F5753
MKKKWLTSLMVSAVLATSVGPITSLAAEQKVNEMQTVNTASLEEAQKNAKITKEEAIELAKKVAKDLTGYKLENVNFNAYGNRTIWDVNWSQRGETYKAINVSVDAQTGDIINFHTWNDSELDKTFPPKVTYDNAVEIAKKYMNDLYPEKMKDIVLDEDFKKYMSSQPYRDRRTHEIRFYQVVDGVPFQNNSVNVSVTGNGTVRSFGFSWNKNVNFKKKENIISLEKANSMVKDSLDVELRYQQNYNGNPDSKNVAKLIYAPKMQNYQYYGGFSYMIDAETGKFINEQGKALDEAAMAPSNTPLSDKASPRPVLQTELTQDAAYKLVKEALNLSDDFILDNASYSEGSRDNQSVWSFNWHKKDNQQSYIGAAINAKTGEILNFNNDARFYNRDNTDFTVNITKDQALKTATDLVKKIAYDKVDSLYVTPPQDQYYNNDKKPKFYTIYFARKVNGIPVQDQGVTVSVSSETGEITNYYQNWRDLEFPDPTKVIDKAQAKDAYLSSSNAKLNYMVPFNPTEQTKTMDDAILVYQAGNNYSFKYLDAVDGKWKNPDTGKVVNDGEPVTDIQGHKFETELQTMIDYNIFDAEDGKVNPEKIVTRGDMVEIMLRAIGEYGYWYDESRPVAFKDVKMSSSYYPYLQRALDRGIVKQEGDNFEPDKAVTREDVAVFLVRSLGYDKLASTDGIFAEDFKDKDQIKYKGHVSLIKKLGIINGNEDGEFMPEKTVTKADVSVILYRFLDKYSQLSGR